MLNLHLLELEMEGALGCWQKENKLQQISALEVVLDKNKQTGGASKHENKTGQRRPKR